MMLVTYLFLGLTFLQSPTIGKKQQTPSQQKTDATKQLPTSSPKPTTTVISNVHSAQKENNPKEESKWWPPPPVWDIYWPTLGLLAIAGVAAWIAVSTLGDIRKQTIALKTSTNALINSERAWVLTHLDWIDRTRIVHIDTDKTGIDIGLVSINNGRTPAWVIETRVRLAIVDSIPPIPIFEPVGPGDFRELVPVSLSVGGKGDVIRVDCHCVGRPKPEKFTIVYGFVKYRDIFIEDVRETRFGYSINTNGHLERIPSAEYNKNT